MPQYKLTYFHFRALGEPIRLIFHLAGVPFEDYRIPRDKWSDYQPDIGSWGKLPILHIDGEPLAQSTAIGRYLAKQFNLTGANELESVRCDEIADAVIDLKNLWLFFFKEQDAEKKAVIKESLLIDSSVNMFLRFLKKLNERVESTGGDFVVGKEVTWADLFLANFTEIFEVTLKEDLLDEFPALKRQQIAVYSIPRIKEWVEKRPKTLI